MHYIMSTTHVWFSVFNLNVVSLQKYFNLEISGHKL